MYLDSWFHTFQSLVVRHHDCGLWGDGHYHGRGWGRAKLLTSGQRKLERKGSGQDTLSNATLRTFHSAPISEEPKDDICILMIQRHLLEPIPQTNLFRGGAGPTLLNHHSNRLIFPCICYFRCTKLSTLF